MLDALNKIINTSMKYCFNNYICSNLQLDFFETKVYLLNIFGNAFTSKTAGEPTKHVFGAFADVCNYSKLYGTYITQI